jgi:hypothetical protein
MQTEKENTKPGGTWVSESTITMEAPEPGPGLLNTEDHEWSKIMYRGKASKVEAVPKDSLEKLVAGNGERGCTIINVAHTSHNRSVALVEDLVCERDYGFEGCKTSLMMTIQCMKFQAWPSMFYTVRKGTPS